jgi:ribose-phosphate pyrophosphokinase
LRKVKQALCIEVAERLGMNLSKIEVQSLSDGEIDINIIDVIDGEDIYLIQPTSNPVNENLMELLLLISALKKASANSVTVIIPYYSYARSVMRHADGVPIAAGDVAKMLEIAGVDRVLTVELHAPQIEGFFKVPVDSLESNIIMVDYLLNSNLILDYDKLVIVSPDANGVNRAKKFLEIVLSATGANIGLSMLVGEKNIHGQKELKLVGDVKGCEVIIYDDLIDTGDTVITAAEELVKNGATKVYAFVTHGIFTLIQGVLSHNAIERIKNSKVDKVILTNTIAIEKLHLNDQFVILSTGTLIAEAIRRINLNESLSDIFI